jgi:hypothetical protein
MAGSKGGQGPGSGKRKQFWEKIKYVSTTKLRQGKRKEYARKNWLHKITQDIWKKNIQTFFNPRPAASVREVAKPGKEHGEVSDLDLDISRSGSDRSMSPPEAEEFNVDRLLRSWSFLLLKFGMRTEK